MESSSRRMTEKKTTTATHCDADAFEKWILFIECNTNHNFHIRTAFRRYEFFDGCVMLIVL